VIKKIDKDEARYQNAPKGTQWCSRCNMFRKPDSCTLVVGKISPGGWCRYWERKE